MCLLIVESLAVNTLVIVSFLLFQGCVAIISMTWIMSVTLFSILVLPRGGYYFNSSGMVACEPFYSQAAIRILAACGFYFPTTMILMYCYGSAFHVNKLRLKKTGCNTIASPEERGSASIEKVSSTIIIIYIELWLVSFPI